MFVITIKNSPMTQLVPVLQRATYREDVQESVKFNNIKEAKVVYKMILAAYEYSEDDINITHESNVPSRFAQIKYRAGSKTGRPVGWKIPPSASYCSMCGVSVAGVEYLIVDSIRFCPFCVKRLSEKLEQVLQTVPEEATEEYYNVFVLENL